MMQKFSTKKILITLVVTLLSTFPFSSKVVFASGYYGMQISTAGTDASLKRGFAEEWVAASDERFKTNIIDISSLTSLETLYAGKNSLQDISFLSNLHNLKVLDLDRNKIENIEPLTNLEKLRALYLNHNSISNLEALTNLTQLEFLYLWDNNVVDILPLVNNTGIDSLDRVELRINPLSDVSINTYIPQLREREVSVSY